MLMQRGGRGKRGGGGLNGFKFAIFIGRFRSDGAASMAVKGKICRKTKRADNPQQTVLQVCDLVSNLVRKPSCLPKLSSRV